MEDNAIIELFFARSEQAIRELSDKYGALCFQVADNILHNRADAEECVNDACLGVWNTVPPQKPEVLVSYVCRITRNLALKKYHHNTAAKRNRQYDLALEELEGCIPSAFTVEEALDAEETARIINGFLASLDRDSRMMFVRRYWYADSVDTLAALFCTSPHAVSNRLLRIRKKLKKHLQKEGIAC